MPLVAFLCCGGLGYGILCCCWCGGLGARVVYGVGGMMLVKTDNFMNSTVLGRTLGHSFRIATMIHGPSGVGVRGRRLMIGGTSISSLSRICKIYGKTSTIVDTFGPK